MTARFTWGRVRASTRSKRWLPMRASTHAGESYRASVARAWRHHWMAVATERNGTNVRVMMACPRPPVSAGVADLRGRARRTMLKRRASTSVTRASSAVLRERRVQAAKCKLNSSEVHFHQERKMGRWFPVDALVLREALAIFVHRG